MSETEETNLSLEDPAAAPEAAVAMVSATFTDTLGRVWRLELNFSLGKRIRTATGLDLVNFHDGRALITMHEDVEKLVQVLWLLCAGQAEANGIDEESFGTGLGGDALEQAAHAIEQALVNFTRPAMRPAIQAIRTKTNKVMMQKGQLIEEKVNSAKFEMAMAKKLKITADQIDRQIEKSASTPGS